MTVGGVGGAGRYDPPLRSREVPPPALSGAEQVGSVPSETPAAKVERLKQEVAAGTYKPSAQQIAAAILAAVAGRNN